MGSSALLRCHGRRVLLDGVDVRELTQSDCARDRLCSAQATLSPGTVAANVRYGRQGATDEEVRRAAAMRGLDFVEAMPQQFESPIAQAGINLSVGRNSAWRLHGPSCAGGRLRLRRQLLGARLRTTHACVRRCGRKRPRRLSSFRTAHQHVINADRIIVLDEGRVVGIGTHTELLKRSEVYREIVASQLSLDEVA